MNPINIVFPITVFINLLLVNIVVCGGWSYNDPVTGPSTWFKTYPKCSGKKQSPINIDPKKAIFDGSFSDLNIRYSPLVDVNLTNTGKDIAATVVRPGRLNFTGAGLKSTYILHQIHFHVGADSSQGSEHQINGKKYPLELHLIHYNANKSSDLTVVVMSVLVTQGTTRNHGFDKLLDSLQNCSYKGDSTKVLNFSVRNLVPSDDQAFYRYSGSFTTPDCKEGVEWIVFHQTLSLSSTQLQKFRDVYSTSKQDTKPWVHLVNNFRPVQALNGRIILRNFGNVI